MLGYGSQRPTSSQIFFRSPYCARSHVLRTSPCGRLPGTSFWLDKVCIDQMRIPMTLVCLMLMESFGVNIVSPPLCPPWILQCCVRGHPMLFVADEVIPKEEDFSEVLCGISNAVVSANGTSLHLLCFFCIDMLLLIPFDDSDEGDRLHHQHHSWKDAACRRQRTYGA